MTGQEQRVGLARFIRWKTLLWLIPAALVLLVGAVLLAKWLRTTPEIVDFMTQFPGETELAAGAPVGLPAWVGWQHFLNALFMLLIIRTGWQVRTTKRPSAYWTRRNTGLLRTQRPPKKISLDLWLHLSIDAVWLLNGLVFYVLIFVTGQWVRLVPLSWDVFPHAVSVGIQYLSLDWPTENGWVNYNALQLLSYFLVVFVAAPLSFLTGIRMSGAWPPTATRLNRMYPIEWARAIHFPVMLFFVAFIVVHVTLVLATGALRNLNHIYAARDDGSWWGLLVFGISIVVMAVAWVVARPVFLRPVAALTGTVTR